MSNFTILLSLFHHYFGFFFCTKSNPEKNQKKGWLWYHHHVAPLPEESPLYQRYHHLLIPRPEKCLLRLRTIRWRYHWRTPVLLCPRGIIYTIDGGFHGDISEQGHKRNDPYQISFHGGTWGFERVGGQYVIGFTPKFAAFNLEVAVSMGFYMCMRSQNCGVCFCECVFTSYFIPFWYNCVTFFFKT